jgi:hypothetical protein
MLLSDTKGVKMPLRTILQQIARMWGERPAPSGVLTIMLCWYVE